MSIESLNDNLDAIAEAEGGVARLRELILQLAVQGQLVEQNSKDESAIESEALSQVTSPSSTPLGQLPSTWYWTTLGQISESVQYGYTASANHTAGNARLLRITDIQDNRVNWESVPHCEIEQAKLPSYALKPNDILIARTGGTVGKSFLVSQVPVISVFASYLIRIRLRVGFLATYVKLALESPLYWKQITSKAVGTGQPNVNGSGLASLFVPIAPLAEQKRIVAKVDELMALCDELEQKQEQRHTVRRAAHTSALEALTNAQTPDELAHAWGRLQKHWDVLAAHADAVPPLRQVILQLAVQGRLLAQDTDDEPAISLLSQIADRHAVARAGKASGQNELYLLPCSWNWARFDEIAAIRSNLVDPSGFREAAHIAPNHIEKGTGRLLPYGSIGDDKVISGKHRFYAGQILYSKIRPNLSKAALVDFEGLCSADMYPIEPWIDSRYLLTFILSETFLRQVTAEDNRVAMPKVNQEQLSMVRVAVPPLAEQKRIVARVDELMALCDSLEQRAREQEALASQLAHAAVTSVATG